MLLILLCFLKYYLFHLVDLYYYANLTVVFFSFPFSQWRKGLKLSGEAAVEKITLDGVKGLRVMLGATAHDVLYYMSPIYCQDIINSVVLALFGLLLFNTLIISILVLHSSL